MPKKRFPDGWRPLVSTQQKGWQRAQFSAYNVSASRNLKDWDYYLYVFNENRNTIVEKIPKGAKNTNVNKSANCLVFNYQNDEDTAFIASNYPYPFSRMLGYLQGLRSCNYVKVMKIGTTDCFNQIPMIEIRHSTNSKKLLVITARVHPQDTAGSFALEGFIDFIIGRKNEEYEQKLRDIKDSEAKRRYEHFVRQLQLFQGVILEHFTVLVFPFLNIDGSLLGNSTFDSERQDLRVVKRDSALLKSHSVLVQTVADYVNSGLQFSHFLDLSDSTTKEGIYLQ